MMMSVMVVLLVMMVVVVLMAAKFTGIHQGSVEVGFQDFLDIPFTASDHFDPCPLENLEGTCSHVSGQHQRDAFVGQGFGDVGFATTALG